MLASVWERGCTGEGNLIPKIHVPKVLRILAIGRSIATKIGIHIGEGCKFWPKVEPFPPNKKFTRSQSATNTKVFFLLWNLRV